MLNIRLVYSPQARCVYEAQLQLPEGACVAQALQACTFLQALNLTNPPSHGLHLGIWGRCLKTAENKLPLQHPLQDGDRLEIYRPLQVDPQTARRLRFAKQSSRKGGASV